MTEMALYKNMWELGAGIELCIEHELIPSALVLQYSAIDVAGWLHNEDPDATNTKSFTAWVDAYLLKAMPLNCTAIDMYAARNGAVHTFTPEARLIDQGKARRICYAWGRAKVEDLQKTIDRSNQGADYVAVHLRDLFQGWARGVARFCVEVEQDAARAARVYARAAKFFGHLPRDVVERFIAITDRT